MAGRNVYIVDCVRSPLGRGKKNGALFGIRPIDLLAASLKEVVKRANVASEFIEDVVCGCVLPHGEQGGNIARLGALKAGFPVTVPGVQLDRQCGSAQQAVHFMSQAIASGDMDLGIAAGIEMLSVNPMGQTPAKVKARKQLLTDFPFQLTTQHISAEACGEKYNVSREDCNQFAYESHTKAGLAQQNGFYDSQIMPIKNPRTGQVVTRDEGIRYPSDLGKIRKLKSLFKENGVVSAGTASQISDGSSAILLASADAVRRHGLRVRAKVMTRYVTGSDPILMLDGVIAATQKCVAKAGLTLDDIDLFEVNEAFAVVPLCWLKTLKVDPRKLNVCGGAVAHGHPLGATGCILMTKLVNDLERTGKRYGLQTMCIGAGQATATILKRCDAIEEPLRAKL